MSQDTQNISNVAGASYRAAVNSNLQALASTSKGSSRPATAYAGQLWWDENTPSSAVWTLYCYDGAGDIPLGYLDTTNDRFVTLGTRGADVASASTIDLGAATGDCVDVTGTTTITAVTLAEGLERTVRFTAATTLSHGSSLVLPGAADITTAAGDFGAFRGYAAGVVRMTSFLRADGTPVGGASYKVGSTTYDLSTASGSLAITGVGFKPKLVVIDANVDGSARSSHGYSDGSTHRCQYTTNAATWTQAANVFLLYTDGTNFVSASVSAMGSDGFTLSITKTGTPTGTANLSYQVSR